MLDLAIVLTQTVLIAGDDAELCDLYRRFLTTCGYEVETSSDGLDCLRKLRWARPAVLVLDLKLCWGGGDGILAWLREENPGHAIPVILMTTAGDPQALASFIEPPVVDYLANPFALTALLRKVRSAVAEMMPQDPSSWLRDCPELLIG
jgi:DNA-binding response OmpR family regulator